MAGKLSTERQEISVVFTNEDCQYGENTNSLTVAKKAKRKDKNKLKTRLKFKMFTKVKLKVLNRNGNHIGGNGK